MNDPRDNLSQDQVLWAWQQLKDKIADLKEQELEYRKYVVKRAFPQAQEGTNTLDLGNGFSLKAGVKFNYNLLPNDVVEKELAAIAKIGNEGPFIADRLVSWTPNFLLTEYRVLQEQSKNDNETATRILKHVHNMLEIKDAAPSLDIKEPKKKK